MQADRTIPDMSSPSDDRQQKKCLRLSVRGFVQGVGFRPFIYRLASELELTGWVCNTARGVQIEVVPGSPLTAVDMVVSGAADIAVGVTPRWDGADRYETAVKCARMGVARGWLDLDTIGVATGLSFPDALSGGAACGSYGSPLVLTGPTWIPEKLDSYFGTERYWFGGMDVFGGVSAVNDTVFTSLDDYLF